MVGLTGYLRARLGRRIALLFFLCAIVPILAFSVVSFTHARAQLAEQSRERLRLLGKEGAQALLYRLHAASLEAIHWASADENRDSLMAWFDAIRVVDDPARPNEALEGVPLPPITDEPELDRLARGGTVLAVVEGHVLLAHAVAGDPARGVAWLALDADYLAGRLAPWGLEGPRSPLPAGIESCLLAHDGPLTPCPPDLVNRLKRDPPEDGGDTRHFRWAAGDTDYFASRRPVFLKAAFGAPAWELVLSERRDRALAPARGFQRTFLLSALLSLLIVPFLSQVQIRRNLEPLARLEEGTRRIADRDFESTVEIDSGDEFEHLADSFNDMARRLGRQFGALRATNEIDRAILGALQRETIVRGLLQRAPDVLPGAELVILTREPDGRVLVHARPGGESAGSIAVTPRVASELLDRAASAGDEPVRLTGEPIPTPAHWTLHPVGVEAGARGAREVPAAILVGTPTPQSEDDLEHAAHMADRLAVALANARLVDELDRLNTETITAFARAIDAKSAWTAGHSERVTDMALAIAAELGVTGDDLELLRRGGLLHDIGKIGIPSAILDKPGKLTAAEFEIMKSHTTVGASILEPISGLRGIIPIARHHHERFDGGGYPDGLADEEIPFLARVVAVADVYDALTSARPYRDALPIERVVDIVIGDAGTAFDPAVVRAFERAVIDLRVEVA